MNRQVKVSKRSPISDSLLYTMGTKGDTSPKYLKKGKIVPVL